MQGVVDIVWHNILIIWLYKCKKKACWAKVQYRKINTTMGADDLRNDMVTYCTSNTKSMWYTAHLFTLCVIL